MHATEFYYHYRQNLSIMVVLIKQNLVLLQGYNCFCITSVRVRVCVGWMDDISH